MANTKEKFRCSRCNKMKANGRFVPIDKSTDVKICLHCLKDVRELVLKDIFISKLLKECQ